GCLQNMALLQVSMNMYAAENDQTYPVSDWMDHALPYLPGQTALYCPTARSEDPSAFGYALNKQTAGKAISEFERPQFIALVFDSENTEYNAIAPLSTMTRDRHVGQEGFEGANVAFITGSAMFLRRTQIEALLRGEPVTPHQSSAQD
ncbi:MAG: hypothetical protein ACK4P3_09165, partial [Fimbriimonadaceae bacterium]